MGTQDSADAGAPEFAVGSSPLEAILATRELADRPSRAPDYCAESDALRKLAHTLGQSPRAALQELCQQALLLCRAESAGISIAEQEGQREIFRWHATAGGLSSFEGATMPRDFSPCGVVLDTGSAQLMSEMQRHFAYVEQLGIHLQEVLLVPFFQEDVAVGTIWVVAHSPEKRFDGEDSRLLHSLAAATSGIVGSHLKLLELERTKTRLLENEERLQAAVLAAERSVADLQRERSLRDQFVATLTHDLRTPLNIAKVTLYLVGEELAKPARASTAPEIACGHVERGMRAIGRIDDMARRVLDTVEATTNGRSASHFERCDLATLLRDATDDMNLIYDNRIALAACDSAIIGFWDAGGLRRAVENLVSNAVKYGETDRPIRIASVDVGGQIFVIVHNEGNPIGEAEQATLFDPYKRTNHSRTSNEQGWGLGLALVKGIADAHGGTITLVSSAETGTTFTLCLPIDSRSALV